MFYLPLCGAFHHQEQEDDDDEIWMISHGSTTRKSGRKKDIKNPYSTRGLDRFGALLADLEEKRQQIYSTMGAQGVVVRFVCKSSSNDCVPVVVKLKNPIRDEKIKPGKKTNDHHHQPERVVSNVTDHKLQNPSESSDQKIEKNKRFSWKVVELQNLRRPSHYLPAVIISILLFLVVFGRSAAILCTCIVWYMVPTISGESSNLRTSMKKKDYRRKLSENKFVNGKLSFSK